MSGQPRPMKYHGPGWSLTVHEDTPREHRYMVWAPGQVMHDGEPSDTGKVRTFWQSSWRGSYGGTGGGTRGRSMDEVLALFPAAHADAFRQVITAAGMDQVLGDQ